MAGFLGCSSQPEGVDDDAIGAALNYACSLALFGVALRIYRRHRSQPFALAVTLTELGMSLGYLLGGVVHGTFPNRASDDNCASRFFYPLFSVSYLSMIGSCVAWLSLAGPSRPKKLAEATLLASSLFIAGGAAACQATVELYPGRTDDCPPARQASCDRAMMFGEGLFYFVWCLCWLVVARDLHRRCLTRKQRVLNFLAPAALLLGPGQILLVCLLPVVFAPSVSVGMERSMALYCALRTGVTYILAVLACHLFTARVSERLLFGQDPEARGFRQVGSDEESGGGGCRHAGSDEESEDEMQL
ncbi:hypothetical protein TeGR_g3478 [Tetraparma gracilis]|uniref:Uncharacterized protein n=1 Tax=Tetraparma gracilis TaxID=2962635 RepID=A0ABQ6MYP8_9STRA|nr:hypothetical protein TeGR_g3478 [Tetraparma gracilis]